MKQIPQKPLDELIRLTKKYYSTGDVDILAARTEAATALSTSLRGDNLANYCFADIVGAIFNGFGLKKDATRQDVYDVFALLGYEVVAENKGEENGTA